MLFLKICITLKARALEPEFPIEFLVHGTPVSLQAKRPESRAQWQERVRLASRAVLPEGHWATTGRVSVTMYYFPDAPMRGDIDNIVKPVLDALGRHIYLDDSQVERVVIQKFEPGNIFSFATPSATLAAAMDARKPVLYVRLSENPFEELS
jgi:crossover junction endodeoxyribonuclease RusA